MIGFRAWAGERSQCDPGPLGECPSWCPGRSELRVPRRGGRVGWVDVLRMGGGFGSNLAGSTPGLSPNSCLCERSSGAKSLDLEALKE